MPSGCALYARRYGLLTPSDLSSLACRVAYRPRTAERSRPLPPIPRCWTISTRGFFHAPLAAKRALPTMLVTCGQVAPCSALRRLGDGRLVERAGLHNRLAEHLHRGVDERRHVVVERIDAPAGEQVVEPRAELTFGERSGRYFFGQTPACSSSAIAWSVNSARGPSPPITNIRIDSAFGSPLVTFSKRRMAPGGNDTTSKGPAST